MRGDIRNCRSTTTTDNPAARPRGSSHKRNPYGQPGTTSSAGVHGRIVERLPVGDRHALMRHARRLEWPSKSSNEAFELVAAPAMACGTPVLASDGGVAPYAVQRGQAVFAHGRETRTAWRTESLKRRSDHRSVRSSA